MCFRHCFLWKHAPKNCAVLTLKCTHYSLIAFVKFHFMLLLYTNQNASMSGNFGWTNLNVHNKASIVTCNTRLLEKFRYYLRANKSAPIAYNNLSSSIIKQCSNKLSAESANQKFSNSNFQLIQFPFFQKFSNSNVYSYINKEERASRRDTVRHDYLSI